MSGTSHSALKQLLNDEIFLRKDSLYGDDFFIKTITGVISDLSTGSTPLLWNLGIEFTFLSENTQLFASSSNAGDTTTVIRVEYVDEECNFFTTTVTLNGQTNVTLLVSDTFQINNLTVISGAINAGNIYFHTNVSGTTSGVPNDLSEVQGYIEENIGVSRTAKFTTYNGYTTIVKTYIASAANVTTAPAKIPIASIIVNSRGENGITVKPSIRFLASGSVISFLPKGPSIASKTTLFVTANTNENGEQVTFTASLYMVKDSLFNLKQN